MTKYNTNTIQYNTNASLGTGQSGLTDVICERGLLWTNALYFEVYLKDISLVTLKIQGLAHSTNKYMSLMGAQSLSTLLMLKLMINSSPFHSLLIRHIPLDLKSQTATS